MTKPMCCGYTEPCEICQRVKEFAEAEKADMERVLKGDLTVTVRLLLESRRDTLRHILETMGGEDGLQFK